MRLLIFITILLFPYTVNAQISFRLNSGSEVNNYYAASSITSSISHSSFTPNESSSNEKKCLKAGQWIGAIAGSTMGLLHLYWSATGVSGIHGSFGENLVTAVPSIVFGAYIGSHTTEWATRQIMKGKPKVGKAILKGMAYGAIDGAITLTASLLPILIIGHYMGTIHFNFNDDQVLLKIIGSAMMGGALYGGLIGATIGAVYGPSISVYMKF